MKKVFKEFRSFIAKGNVVDMAVGVIVGGAFGKIVTSLVNDIIMPIVSLAMGGKSLSSLVLVLNGQPLFLDGGATNPAALVWHYGSFIQSIIDFLIIAICVFLIMKLFVTLQHSAAAAKGALEKGIKEIAHHDEPTESAAAPEVATTEVAPAVTEKVMDAVQSSVSDVNKNDEIITLLTEIRNSLKKEEK